MSEKERYKNQLAILICGGNAFKAMSLDPLFEKYTLDVLKEAYDSLQTAVDKDKVAMSVKAFERNCEWADERINGKKKLEKRKEKRDSIDDLLEQYPQYADKIKIEHDNFIAKETIAALIKVWDKEKRLKEEMEHDSLYWSYLSVDGKKRVAEDLVSSLTTNSWYALAYNKTREFFAEPGIPYQDVNKSAFFLSAKSYLVNNKEKYLDFIKSETELSYDAFEYFEQRLDKALSRRGY